MVIWQILNVHFCNGFWHSAFIESHRDFAGGVDFAYWWSCIGKGLRLQRAQQACLGIWGVIVTLKDEIFWSSECYKALYVLDNCIIRKTKCSRTLWGTDYCYFWNIKLLTLYISDYNVFRNIAVLVHWLPKKNIFLVTFSSET